VKTDSILNKAILTLVIFFYALQLFSQVTINGTVKNIKDTVLVFTKNIPDPILRDVSKRYKARIRNGSFSISLPENNIGEWIITFGNDGFQFLNLIKGQNLKIEADFSRKFPLKATGSSAADFNYLASWWELMLQKSYYTSKYFKAIERLDFDSTLLKRKSEYDYAAKLLEEYKRSNKLSDKYYKWLKSKYKYEPYMVNNAEGLGKQEKENFFDQIRRIGLNDDYAAINNYAYATIVDRYVDFKFNGGVYPMGVVDHLEFIMNGKAVSGLTLQSCLARELSQLTSSPKWDTLYSKFLSSITDKRLLAYVNGARNSYLVSIGAVKSEEYIHPDLTLSAIFSKYKGKVLYVDFWASWCGPCRNEMPNAAALKEKLVGKDVVFIYLGYGDKKDNWLAARKDLEIEGEHYLLDDKQIKEAEELFEINGIPHYVIIDKQGRILAKHAERPGQIYERLLELL